MDTIYTQLANFFVKHPNLTSFLHTLITEVMFDATIGTAFSQVVLQADVSSSAIHGLGYALFRTFFRVLRQWIIDKAKITTPASTEVK